MSRVRAVLLLLRAQRLALTKPLTAGMAQMESQWYTMAIRSLQKFSSEMLWNMLMWTINKHAFVKNEFLVILSIVNYCNIQQQRKIAQYLKGIF
ncbi:1-phosphatidylinositol 4,5-bisphosphate phosphodiesterase eta-1-like [Manis javanica]|uniref:1-phosphatidylinositol 4,5-bisphosphate phosphodiesterase eta-1-like n=1 Tax=Manis javanica TaxID=9974 RepID=UPI003C6D1162